MLDCPSGYMKCNDPSLSKSKFPGGSVDDAFEKMMPGASKANNGAGIAGKVCCIWGNSSTDPRPSVVKAVKSKVKKWNIALLVLSIVLPMIPIAGETASWLVIGVETAVQNTIDFAFTLESAISSLKKSDPTFSSCKDYAGATWDGLRLQDLVPQNGPFYRAAYTNGVDDIMDPYYVPAGTESCAGLTDNPRGRGACLAPAQILAGKYTDSKGKTQWGMWSYPDYCPLGYGVPDQLDYLNKLTNALNDGVNSGAGNYQWPYTSACAYQGEGEDCPLEGSCSSTYNPYHGKWGSDYCNDYTADNANVTIVTDYDAWVNGGRKPISCYQCCPGSEPATREANWKNKACTMVCDTTGKTTGEDTKFQCS